MPRRTSMITMAVEIAIFFLSSVTLFYLITGRDSLSGAVYLAFISTAIYAAVTFTIRYREGRDGERRGN